jgi:ubiquinone/menaquinone biosynthesis C-methylase UbiE
MDALLNWATFDARAIPSSLRVPPELCAISRPGARIVDLGCGIGNLCLELASSAGVEVSGIDVNSQAIEIAAARAELLGLPAMFGCADVGRGTGLEPNHFSVSVMQAFLSVLRDRAERAAALREAYRILQPRGLLFFHDFAQAWHHPLYRKRYLSGLREFAEAGTFRVNLESPAPVEYVAHHFSEREIVALLSRERFRIVRFKYTRVQTQSGNRIYGFIIIARKMP